MAGTQETQPDSGLAIKRVESEERRVVALGYVARKASGELALDSVGSTVVAGVTIDNGSDRDVVDTPEALHALKNAFYDYLSRGSLVRAATALKAAVRDYLTVDGAGSRKTLRAALNAYEGSANDGGMDDMHVDFDVARAVGGVMLEPDLSAALIGGQETYKALVTQLEAAIAEPDAEKQKTALAGTLEALKAYPPKALPTAALIVGYVPPTERGEELWTAIKSGQRPMLSMVSNFRREVVACAA